MNDKKDVLKPIDDGDRYQLVTLGSFNVPNCSGITYHIPERKTMKRKHNPVILEVSVNKKSGLTMDIDSISKDYDCQKRTPVDPDQLAEMYPTNVKRLDIPKELLGDCQPDPIGGCCLPSRASMCPPNQVSFNKFPEWDLPPEEILKGIKDHIERIRKTVPIVDRRVCCTGSVLAKVTSRVIAHKGYITHKDDIVCIWNPPAKIEE